MGIINAGISIYPFLYRIEYMKEVVVTTIRLPGEIHTLLSRVTKNRGENVSLFIRRLVIRELASLSYLNDDVKKSLGVTSEDTTVEEAVSE